MTKAAKKKEILLPIFSMRLTCLKETSTSVLFLACYKRPFAYCKSDEKFHRKNNLCDIIFCSIIIVSLTSLSLKDRSLSYSKLHVKEISLGYVKGNVKLNTSVFSGFNLPIILNLPSLGQFGWSTYSKENVGGIEVTFE